jgi:hypothetical protein
MRLGGRVFFCHAVKISPTYLPTDLEARSRPSGRGPKTWCPPTLYGEIADYSRASNPAVTGGPQRPTGDSGSSFTSHGPKEYPHTGATTPINIFCSPKKIPSSKPPPQPNIQNSARATFLQGRQEKNFFFTKSNHDPLQGNQRTGHLLQGRQGFFHQVISPPG